MRVLVTCPPMARAIEKFRPLFASRQVEVDAPAVVQTLSEAELVRRVPLYDGWIIGDDPATRAVFAAGAAGRLRAAVKWGVGTDNVDVAAAEALGIPVANTPEMFGAEVADVALGYLIGLARELFAIDRGVRRGEWPKFCGVSLAGRTVGLVGFGDIGRQLARRLLALDLKVIVYDPKFAVQPGLEAVAPAPWPERIEEADFLVLACALTPESRHMLNEKVFARARRGLRIVNAARGALIDERALVGAMAAGTVRSAALDVFEKEPLPADSPLRRFGDRVVFGTHNASNTAEAVVRASRHAIELLFDFLGV